MDPLYEQFKKAAEERNRKIIAARKAGLSLAELAKTFDLTPQRVSKICESLRKDRTAA